MENKRLIIGLVGQIACGKGAAKKYLINQFGASDYRFSTILRDVLARLHTKISRENIQTISTCLRQTFGEDLLANAMAEDIKNDEHRMIVIDGIRRLTDIQHLKEVPGFVLVSIDADEKVRYDRMKLRNENEGDDKKSFEDFQADQQKESEAQIPDAMKHADYHIDNNDGFDALEKQVNEIVAKVQAKYGL